jgi:endonuclease/exonuclease/phosphatase family metal-dependent hydrolase
VAEGARGGLGLAQALLPAAAVPAGCPRDGGDAGALPDGPKTFKVLTQNLSLGADLDIALASNDLALAVDQMWATVEATNFPERAKVLADVIRAVDADLIGVQEASLWRARSPADDSPVPNATAVRYDFLKILLDELRRGGDAYEVVVAVENVDVELTGASGTAYRLTDRDAIIARSSVPIVATYKGMFAAADLAAVTVSSGPGGVPLTVPVPRGWVAADFRAGGKTIRLVNTHLEVLSSEVAARQALAVVDVAAPTEQPAIVIGDMNLPPGSAGYANLVAAGTGLADAWTELGAGAGLTCCWNRDLMGGAFYNRIDLVLHTGDVPATSAEVVAYTETTARGLHASDHAGVAVGFSTGVQQ